MTDHLGDARRDLVFGGGEEHRQEALDDEVVQLLFGLGQVLRRLQRRDDGEVVADLRIVEDAFVRLDPAAVQHLLGVRQVVVAFLQHLQRAAYRIQIIFRQRARIGTRIGQYLVPFVQGLGQAQRVLGREAEAAVGLALQAGQVEQQRRQLGRRLGFLGDRAGLVAAGGHHRFGGGGAPQARIALLGVEFVLLECRVVPAAFVEAGGADEFGLHFPIVARHETANLFLALDHDGQCRRLNPADGGQEKAAALAVERGHRARAVDPDQPIGFGAAARGVGERLHVFVAAQPGEAVAYRGRRHRLEPEPHDRLLGFRVLDDVAENQLALAPRVAGVDQFGDVLALEQAAQDFQPGFAFCDRIEVKMRGNDGEISETPLAPLDFVFFRRGDFEQMADGRRYDVLVVFEVFVMLGKATENTHDVIRDRWLLGDDQGFGHERGLEINL